MRETLHSASVAAPLGTSWLSKVGFAVALISFCVLTEKVILSEATIKASRLETSRMFSTAARLTCLYLVRMHGTLQRQAAAFKAFMYLQWKSVRFIH